MFDELFDLFDRDRNRRGEGAAAPRRGGLRGALGRLFDGHDERDERDACRTRVADADDDMFDDDRRVRRRERDRFDTPFDD